MYAGRVLVPTTARVLTHTVVITWVFVGLCVPGVSAKSTDVRYIWAEDPENDLRLEYPAAQEDDYEYLDMRAIVSEYNATGDMLSFVIEVVDATGVTERGSDWAFACAVEYRVFLEDRFVRRMIVGVESSATSPEIINGLAFSFPASQPTQQRSLYNESNSVFERPGVYSVTLERQALMNEGDRITLMQARCTATTRPAGLLGFVVEDRNDNRSSESLVYSDLVPQRSDGETDGLPESSGSAENLSPEADATYPQVVGILVAVGSGVAIKHRGSRRK